MNKINYIALTALTLLTLNSQVFATDTLEDDTSIKKTSRFWGFKRGKVKNIPDNVSVETIETQSPTPDSQVGFDTSSESGDQLEIESLIDLEEEAKLNFQNRASKIYRKLLAERTLRNDKLNRFRISFLKKPTRFFSKMYYYHIFTEENTKNKQDNINKSVKKLSKENKIKNKAATKFINMYLDTVEGIHNEKRWDKVLRKVEEKLGEDDFSYLLEAITDSYSEDGEVKLKTSNS